MSKNKITLYAREGWAVSYESKEDFVKDYSYQTARDYIGKQYDQLCVERDFLYNYETEERILYQERRSVIKYDYILRDHNGDPLTASDLPYIYSVKRRNAVINTEESRPVPKTGKSRFGKRGRHNKTGKGFLQYCGDNEKKTSGGVDIPPVRSKVVKALKERKVWQYYDQAPHCEENKSWKKYRKNQWK